MLFKIITIMFQKLTFSKLIPPHQPNQNYFKTKYDFPTFVMQRYVTLHTSLQTKKIF